VKATRNTGLQPALALILRSSGKSGLEAGAPGARLPAKGPDGPAFQGGGRVSDIILHHYPESLFSEKARAMLNAKGLSWRSVIIPMIMPRPDTIPLTGGYRRTPVMQVGADVYCDTAMIAAYLDDKGEGPTFYPAGSRVAAQTLARWIDTDLFWGGVTIRFQPQNMAGFLADTKAASAFAADRAAFSQGSTTRRIPLEEALPRHQTFLAELEAQLSDGRAYLFGPDWSIADFSTYHVLWFVHAGTPMADMLAGHPSAQAWFDRMRAFGAKKGEPTTGADALKAAADATPAAVVGGTSDLPDIPVGTLVDVGPTDYGVMPSRGELLHCDPATIVIRREHERTGPVNVHFPRYGFGATRV
jgi:glutathione S-transferase